MNRRTFLSALAATSLTPLMPAQIFASGGIVNPEHCGFTGEYGINAIIPVDTYPTGIPSIHIARNMVIQVMMDDDEWHTVGGNDGLVTVTTGPTWAEKTPDDILADIQTFLDMPAPEPADRVILTEDRYTRFLRA